MFCRTAYNKLDANGKQWSDPTVFDAPLTAKGRQQVRGVVVGSRAWGACMCCAGATFPAPGRTPACVFVAVHAVV
jgi:DUF1680 family protein